MSRPNYAKIAADMERKGKERVAPPQHEHDWIKYRREVCRGCTARRQTVFQRDIGRRG